MHYNHADLDGQRMVNSGQRDGKNGKNGEVQLTVKEMLDVPSDSGAPDLAQGDREAFAEAGVLERSRSLQPGDRVPPQPLVKTLEEVADKLGEHSSWLKGSADLTLPCTACHLACISGSDSVLVGTYG